MNKYYVYILTNRTNNVLYIGVTNNIGRRIFEHKEGVIEGFTKKYKIHKLVYVEEYIDIKDAILREKRLKHWMKEWKINLISKANPQWKEVTCV